MGDRVMVKNKKKLYRVIWCLVWLCAVPLQGAYHWPAPKTKEGIQAHRDYLLKVHERPEIRAFSDIIAMCEGTDFPTGYRMLFQPGHKGSSRALFDSYADHPRKVICVMSNGSRLCSSAAGRYQIMPATWDDIYWKIGAEDFSPLNQDLAFIQLMLERQALEDLLHGDFDKALKKASSIWASFPYAPYGQPTKKIEVVRRWYADRLALYKSVAKSASVYKKGRVQQPLGIRDKDIKQKERVS